MIGLGRMGGPMAQRLTARADTGSSVSPATRMRCGSWRKNIVPAASFEELVN